jgi:hypothetical protein
VKGPSRGADNRRVAVAVHNERQRRETYHLAADRAADQQLLE